MIMNHVYHLYHDDWQNSAAFSKHNIYKKKLEREKYDEYEIQRLTTALLYVYVPFWLTEKF